MSRQKPSSQEIALRASGRRRRRPFNPSKWSSSTLSARSKVLCLGVSYPSVRHQIKKNLDSKVQLLHLDESVEQAIELVRRNALTEMDGRDLARCLALEASNDTHAYTVSMENGSIYGNRHLKANFNRKSFPQEIKQVWGNIKFRQVILDYFWIPRGSWVMTHWSRMFFESTLPAFVTEKLLDFSPGPVLQEGDFEISSHDGIGCQDSDLLSSPSGTGGGVVYLPFCLHCVKQVVGAIGILSKYYAISFLPKSQLGEHSLWAATSTIDPTSMQNWLGKAIDQEEIYCTFTPAEFLSSADDEHVHKEDVLRILRGIDNFRDIRMIKLKALKMYDPDYRSKENKSNLGDHIAYWNSFDKKKGFSKFIVPSDDPLLGIHRGGFVGLRDVKDVVNGFDQMRYGGKSSVRSMKIADTNESNTQKNLISSNDIISEMSTKPKSRGRNKKGSHTPIPKSKIKVSSYMKKKKNKACPKLQPKKSKTGWKKSSSHYIHEVAVVSETSSISEAETTSMLFSILQENENDNCSKEAICATRKDQSELEQELEYEVGPKLKSTKLSKVKVQAVPISSSSSKEVLLIGKDRCFKEVIDIPTNGQSEFKQGSADLLDRKSEISSISKAEKEIKTRTSFILPCTSQEAVTVKCDQDVMHEELTDKADRNAGAFSSSKVKVEVKRNSETEAQTEASMDICSKEVSDIPINDQSEFKQGSADLVDRKSEISSSTKAEKGTKTCTSFILPCTSQEAVIVKCAQDVMHEAYEDQSKLEEELVDKADRNVGAFSSSKVKVEVKRNTETNAQRETETEAQTETETTFLLSSKDICSKEVSDIPINGRSELKQGSADFVDGKSEISSISKAEKGTKTCTSFILPCTSQEAVIVKCAQDVMHEACSEQSKLEEELTDEANCYAGAFSSSKVGTLTEAQKEAEMTSIFSSMDKCSKEVSDIPINGQSELRQELNDDVDCKLETSSMTGLEGVFSSVLSSPSLEITTAEFHTVSTDIINVPLKEQLAFRQKSCCKIDIEGEINSVAEGGNGAEIESILSSTSKDSENDSCSEKAINISPEEETNIDRKPESTNVIDTKIHAYPEAEARGGASSLLSSKLQVITLAGMDDSYKETIDIPFNEQSEPMVKFINEIDSKRKISCFSEVGLEETNAETATVAEANTNAILEVKAVEELETKTGTKTVPALSCKLQIAQSVGKDRCSKKAIDMPLKKQLDSCQKFTDKVPDEVTDYVTRYLEASNLSEAEAGTISIVPSTKILSGKYGYSKEDIGVPVKEQSGLRYEFTDVMERKKETIILETNLKKYCKDTSKLNLCMVTNSINGNTNAKFCPASVKSDMPISGKVHHVKKRALIEITSEHQVSSLPFSQKRRKPNTNNSLKQKVVSIDSSIHRSLTDSNCFERPASRQVKKVGNQIIETKERRSADCDFEKELRLDFFRHQPKNDFCNLLPKPDGKNCEKHLLERFAKNKDEMVESHEEIRRRDCKQFSSEEKRHVKEIDTIASISHTAACENILDLHDNAALRKGTKMNSDVHTKLMTKSVEKITKIDPKVSKLDWSHNNKNTVNNLFKTNRYANQHGSQSDAVTAHCTNSTTPRYDTFCFKAPEQNNCPTIIESKENVSGRSVPICSLQNLYLEDIKNAALVLQSLKVGQNDMKLEGFNSKGLVKDKSNVHGGIKITPNSLFNGKNTNIEKRRACLKDTNNDVPHHEICFSESQPYNSNGNLHAGNLEKVATSSKSLSQPTKSNLASKLPRNIAKHVDNLANVTLSTMSLNQLKKSNSESKVPRNRAKHADNLVNLTPSFKSFKQPKKLKAESKVPRNRAKSTKTSLSSAVCRKARIRKHRIQCKQTELYASTKIVGSKQRIEELEQDNLTLLFSDEKSSKANRQIFFHGADNFVASHERCCSESQPHSPNRNLTDHPSTKCNQSNMDREEVKWNNIVKMPSKATINGQLYSWGIDDDAHCHERYSSESQLYDSSNRNLHDDKFANVTSPFNSTTQPIKSKAVSNVPHLTDNISKASFIFDLCGKSQILKDSIESKKTDIYSLATNVQSIMKENEIRCENGPPLFSVEKSSNKVNSPENVNLPFIQLENKGININNSGAQWQYPFDRNYYEYLARFSRHRVLTLETQNLTKWQLETNHSNNRRHQEQQYIKNVQNYAALRRDPNAIISFMQCRDLMYKL